MSLDITISLVIIIGYLMTLYRSSELKSLVIIISKVKAITLVLTEPY